MWAYGSRVEETNNFYSCTTSKLVQNYTQTLLVTLLYIEPKFT